MIHVCCIPQAYAALETSSAQQAKELAAAQSQIKQLGREATASGANTSNLQKQQEVRCVPPSLSALCMCMGDHLVLCPLAPVQPLQIVLIRPA